MVRADEPGPRSSGVVVHANDPRRPKTPLSIAWRTVTPIELEPLVLDFGDVHPDSRQTAEVRVIKRPLGDSDHPCRVVRMESFPADVLAIEPNAAAGEGVESLQVELRAGARLGAGEGVIRAALEGCWTDELRVPVRWRVRDVIDATPASLLLGVGFAGQEVQGTLVVSSRGDGALQVDDARLSAELDWVSAAWRPTSNERVWMIDLTATLPPVPGAHAGELVIECSAPEMRTLRVPLSAHVRGVAPDEEAGPSSVPDQSPANLQHQGDAPPAAASPIRRTES
jgi:hypothetical protein